MVVPEFDPKQQLLEEVEEDHHHRIQQQQYQQQQYQDDETPHGPRSIEENISAILHEDEIGQSAIAGQNTKEKLPLQHHHQSSTVAKPFVRSSANLHSGGSGGAMQRKSTSIERKYTNQHTNNAVVIAATNNSKTAAAVSKQQTAQVAVIGGVAAKPGATTAALKNGNSNRLDKSQQIRNSYNRFVAGQYAQGTNSQRPTANQPAFFAASIGTTAATVQNPLAEPVMQNRPNRRAKGAKNAAPGRSRTVKPQIEAVAAAMGIKTTQLHQTGGGTVGAQGASGHVTGTAGVSTTATNTLQVTAGSMTANTKNVDLLIIGAGPASLGFLVSAVKQQRFSEILQDDGLAILDNGISLGGGMLCNYGINSNTSANSFLKCIFRKAKEKNSTNAAANALQAALAAQANHANATAAHALNKDTGTAKNVKRRQKSVGKERINQHQQQQSTSKPHQSSVALNDTALLAASKPSRERQMSPVIHQKWILNNTNANASNRNNSKQLQATATNDKNQIEEDHHVQHKASRKMFEKVVTQQQTTPNQQSPTFKQQVQRQQQQQLLDCEAENFGQGALQANVVGQPQDPDMEELPICLTSSGEKDKRENVAQKHEEESGVEVVDLQNLCTENLIQPDQQVLVKSNLQPQSNQLLPAYQDALQPEHSALQGNDAVLQDGRQPKKAMRRKKSRDEQSAAGRNSRKQQQVSSVNRQQASGALKVTGMTTTFAQKQSNLKTAAQTSLAIYAQPPNLLQTSGANTKALIQNQLTRAAIGAEPAAKVWTSDDVLTPFKDIFPSNISQLFRRMAKNIVPLSLVGHLLNYVGNHLLHYAYKSTGKRIYMPKHRAMSIHLMGNGEIVTQVLKTDFTILPDPTKSPATFQVVEGKQSIVYFRSKAVVIAGGAQQGLDQRITSEWFPGLAPEKLIASDAFLKKQEYLSQIERLRAAATTLKRRPKIVIIGGSHSGFSCAWLLLNGPAMYNRCYKTLNNQASEPTAASKDQQTQPSAAANAPPRPSSTTAITQPANNKIPYATRKSIKNCIPCCTCGNSVLIASQKLAAQNAGGNTQNQRYLEELRSQSKAGSRAPRGLSVAARELSPINKNGRHLSKTVKQRKDLVTLKQQNAEAGIKGPGGLYSVLSPESKPAKMMQDQTPAVESAAADAPLACSCVCKCLGYFKYDEWPNLDSTANPLELPEFGESDIKILYRDRIKVFFKTVKEAHDAGYTDFDAVERQKKKKDGYVYSFTGLRGDAKQLYLKVTSGEEKRVNFIKADTPELQRAHVEAADLVIWACGYQSNAIKIHDVNKKELALSQKVPGTQYDIDGKNRIILSDGNVLNKVFACGVGFPVRTKDGGVGNADPSKNPRADSFSLYMHTVGEVLLKSLLPKKKIAGIVSHKEVANPYLKAATYEQIMKDKQHKNKKPLLQQVSTKKERNSSKLSQIVAGVNPSARLQHKGNVPLDMVDAQAFMHQEMSNVYLSYLQTAKPGNKINMKLKPPGLNSDLEDLSGFGLISAHASKTNCFSHRAELDAIQEPTNEALMQQTTSFFQEGRNQSKYRDESADLIEDDKINAVLKFPEIKRETPFVSSLPAAENNAAIGTKYNSLNQQSLSSLSNIEHQQHQNVENNMFGGGNQELLDQEQVDDLNDREPGNTLSTNAINNFIPTSSQYQEQKQIDPQQQLYDSNKSLEQVITSTSRNNQVLTPSITGKSPLLLQKKQQMIIQKTKEPLSTHAIIQQTAASNSHHHHHHHHHHQNHNHQQSQNIATMSGLKTTGTGGKNTGTQKTAGKGAAASGKNLVGQSNPSKPGGKMVMHTQDLFKKHHNQVLAAVDQSPYMQFGVQSSSNHNNDGGAKQRNNNASKTAKTTGGGATVKRNFLEKSSTSTQQQQQQQQNQGVIRDGGVKDVGGIGGGIFTKNAHQSSSAVGKQSTGGRHPPQQSKDSISTMIQQNQKAFSEREQHLHARYKAVNVSGLTTSTKQKDNTTTGGVRKEHLASVDVSKSSVGGITEGVGLGAAPPQHHFMLQQLSGSEAGALAMKDVRETFGQHNKSQQQNSNQGMYSVKSLASNSDLFPPITNKLQDLSLSSTISGGKHKRLASSSTNNNNHHQHSKNNNDSVRSLHLSSQQASNSIRQKHSSISAQKAAAVLSQQKSSGLVYAPAVCQQTAVGNRNRQQQQNGTSVTQGAAAGSSSYHYMASSGAAAARSSNTTTAAAQGKTAGASNATGGTNTSYQQVQHPVSQGAQQKLTSASSSSQQHNRTSFSSKKKMTSLSNGANNNNQTQQQPPQSIETALTQNGLIVPVTAVIQDEQSQKNLSGKKMNESSALTSPPQPEPSKPDLCEMGVNDISLRLLQSGAKQAAGDKEDDMGLGQALEDDYLQPESSRTTVIEISEQDEQNYQTSKTILAGSGNYEDEEAKLVIPHDLIEASPDSTVQKKHMTEEKLSSQTVSSVAVAAPKIIQQSGGGNNHFKAAKKMSQNTTSGTYGEIAAAFSASVAAKTPYLRQPSQIHHPKNGDLDHLDQQVKNSHYTSQTIERKDSGSEIVKNSVNRKVEQALNPKASHTKSLANKSPTPHKSSVNPHTSTSNKLQQQQQRSARRHTGAISATDLQALEKTPRGTGGGLKGRQSIGANSVKRPINSVGLFDKFVGEGGNANKHQVIQPYLEHQAQLAQQKQQLNQPQSSQVDSKVTSGKKASNNIGAGGGLSDHQPGSTAARKNQNLHHERQQQTTSVRHHNQKQATAESTKTKQTGAKHHHHHNPSSGGAPDIQVAPGSKAGSNGYHHQHSSKVLNHNHQRTDVSPAKLDADDHGGILDKAQLESNPAAARLLISSVPPANDASQSREDSSALTAKQSVSVFTLASQSNNQLAVAADPHTIKPTESAATIGQTSAFQAASTNRLEQASNLMFGGQPQQQQKEKTSSVTPGYRKAAASGFFVHKTIRDLAISDDPADQLVRETTTNSNTTAVAEPQTEVIQTQQIKAIKKEVQSKVANLSPVLKKRGQSKVNLGIGQAGSKTQQNHPTPGANGQQLNTSKYKSPIRTTLKSAVQYSAKDGALRQGVNSSSNGATSVAVGAGASGNSVRQSQTLRSNHQAAMAQQKIQTLEQSSNTNQHHQQMTTNISSSLRSPKSGVRRTNLLNSTSNHHTANGVGGSETGSHQNTGRFTRPDHSSSNHKDNGTTLHNRSVGGPSSSSVAYGGGYGGLVSSTQMARNRVAAAAAAHASDNRE